MTKDERSHGRWRWCNRRVKVVSTGEEIVLPPETKWDSVREGYYRTGTGPLEKVWGVNVKNEHYLGNLPPSIENDMWVYLDLPTGKGLYVVVMRGCE